MNFFVKSLKANEFSDLFELDNAQLEQRGMKRMTVDRFPGFPCRVSLQDAPVGSEVILLSYPHHNVSSPYKSSGPIFIREDTSTANLKMNEIPTMLDHRLLSLRSYDASGMMKSGLVIEGKDLRENITRIFSDENIEYIQVHNAKPGCFNCEVVRAVESE